MRRLLIIFVAFFTSAYASNSSSVFVTSWGALYDAVAGQAADSVLYAFLDSSGGNFEFDYDVTGKGRIYVGNGKEVNIHAVDTLALDATTKEACTTGSGYFFYVENADLIITGSSQYETLKLKGGINEGTGGGAIGAGANAKLEFTNVEFQVNRATTTGGAVSMTKGGKGSSLTASSVFFNDGSAGQQGSALYLESIEMATLSECKLNSNGVVQTSSAGAVSLLGTPSFPTTAAIMSSEFASNKALGPGSAIAIGEYSKLSIEGIDLHNNENNGKSDSAITVEGAGSSVRFGSFASTTEQCHRDGAAGSPAINIANCAGVSACCNKLKEQLKEPASHWSTNEIAILLTIVVGLMVVTAMLVFYYRKNQQARHHSNLHVTGLFGDKPMKDMQRPLIAGKREEPHFSYFPEMGPSPKTQSKKSAWSIDYKKVNFDKKIGSGAFGSVFQGTFGNTKLPVAIKRIMLSQDPEAFKEQVNQAQSEIMILWELRHPNILQLFGVAFVRERCEELMALVTELCLGSLDVYICTPLRRQQAIEGGMPDLTNNTLLRLMKESAAALAFMHGKGVIHRDLKVRLLRSSTCCTYCAHLLALKSAHLKLPCQPTVVSICGAPSLSSPLAAAAQYSRLARRHCQDRRFWPQPCAQGGQPGPRDRTRCCCDLHCERWHPRVHGAGAAVEWG
jgi:hypothetical protein